MQWDRRLKVCISTLIPEYFSSTSELLQLARPRALVKDDDVEEVLSSKAEATKALLSGLTRTSQQPLDDVRTKYLDLQSEVRLHTSIFDTATQFILGGVVTFSTRCLAGGACQRANATQRATSRLAISEYAA